MVTQALIGKLISLFLVMAGGFILMRLHIIPYDAPNILTKVSVYLITPCAIINSFRNTQTDGLMLQLAFSFAAAIALNILMIALGYLFTRLFKLKPVEYISIAYPNSFNLIVPIISALYPDLLIFASPFMVVQTCLIWSHGRSVICGENGLDLKRMLLSVQIISILIGFILLITQLRLPASLDDAMLSLGNMLGAISVLITGMLIGRMDLKKMLKDPRLYPVSLLRLLVLPGIALFLLKVTGCEFLVENGHQILLISLLAVMTPSAASVQQLAMLYDADADLAGAINIVTMLLCIVTMPLLVSLW